MDCIDCGKSNAFNRVIVNRVSQQQIGLYCENCESDNFGTILDNPTWHQDHGCAFCDNAGTYKLPKLDCLIENDDGSTRHIEYMMFDDTVAICESHLKELVPHQTVIEDLTPKEQKVRSKLEA